MAVPVSCGEPDQLDWLSAGPGEPGLLAGRLAAGRLQAGRHGPAHHPATEHDALAQQLRDPGQDGQHVGQLSLTQASLIEMKQ